MGLSTCQWLFLCISTGLNCCHRNHLVYKVKGISCLTLSGKRADYISKLHLNMNIFSFKICWSVGGSLAFTSLSK